MDVFIDGEIADTFFQQFRAQVESSTDKRIDMWIATIGGNVDAAIAAANYVQAVNNSGKKDIHTNLLSNADSSGTILFLAPAKENRHIVGSSKMFIHEPRYMNMFDVAKVDATKAAEDLELYSNRIADFYVSRIDGLTKSEAQSLMSGERTLSAEDMKEYNIINDIQPSFNIAALKQKSNFNNMGMFKKQKPMTISALKQGENEVQAVHRGELVVGLDIEPVGDVALKGDYIVGKNKLTVSNNVVEAIEPFEEKEEKEDVMDVAAEVSEAVEAAVAPIMDMVEAVVAKMETISGQKSTHKPAKKNVSNVAPQKEQVMARQASKARQSEALNARREKVNARVSNLKIS